jgi:tRNA U34 5-carboxymethylaminomethyl modifying GTPase MnmE/TrmE
VAEAVRAWHATSRQRGAIAIVGIAGPSRQLDEAIGRLCQGAAAPRAGRAALRSLAGIDDGVVSRVDEESALVMPHGGMRIVERLRESLVRIGVAWIDGVEVDPRRLYPEAADRLEALALAAIARAASPLAIPLLLEQAERWRRRGGPLPAEDLARGRRLQRLLRPPRVALVGPANAGKSSLTNALAGRRVSIEAAEPGATRDYTGALLDLAGVRVEWIDTPGVRECPESVEREAVALAEEAVAAADLVVLLAAPDQRWAGEEMAKGGATLRVMSKGDLDPLRLAPIATEAECVVSSHNGGGLSELAAAIRERLVPAEDLRHPGRWRFDERLGDR